MKRSVSSYIVSGFLIFLLIGVTLANVLHQNMILFALGGCAAGVIIGLIVGLIKNRKG